ncbi:hypothetical protein [Pseudomonas sp. KCJK8993]|uniref:hypothetical protein n=1 Tax=Pseudomonas sp. KCJK8993 TaxID=3344565 RepID=UPI0039063C68
MRAQQRCLAGVLCWLLGSEAGAEGFIQDSRLSLRYGQSYWKENANGGIAPTRDEWGQAAQFNFSSGWYRDVLGLDYGYGLADALHVASKADSIGNLRADRSVQSPHGIAKRLELYVRGRWVDEGWTLSGGVGKKSLQLELYTDDRFTRILPAAVLGQDLGYERGGLSLNLSRIEGSGPRNESAGTGLAAYSLSYPGRA